MVDITGKYKMTYSEKFDEYMQAVGVSWVIRKLAGVVESATVEVTKNDSEYTKKTATPVRSSEVKFKLGQEFAEHTIDGRDVKTTSNLDGNILKQVQKDPKGVCDSYIDREYKGDEVTALRLRNGVLKLNFPNNCFFQTIRCNDVVSIRKYTRVTEAELKK